MAVLEKRLQLLLDAGRWELISAEARRTGRSAASIIREAIDARYDADAQQARRTQALGRFIDLATFDEGPTESWSSIKADLQAEIDAHVAKKSAVSP